MNGRMRVVVLMLALALIWACATRQLSGPDTASLAYRYASAENRQRILDGTIGIGMSIPECKASWPDREFEKISRQEIGNSIHETWRVENYRKGMGMVWLWLFVEDGRITMIDERRKSRR